MADVRSPLLWFRNDLRIHDHRILSSLPASTEQLLCVFVIDPRWFRNTPLGFPKTGERRRAFLLQTLDDLDRSLQRLGQRLLVVEGEPSAVIPDLARAHGCDAVISGREATTEEVDDENALDAALGIIPYHRFWDRTLVHPDDLPFAVSDVPDVFTSFRKHVERSWHIRPTYPTPVTLPPPPSNVGWRALPEPPAINTDARSAFPFHGGEQAALGHLQAYIHTHGHVRSYKQTRNGLIGTEYSSKLSPWLATGALSPRQVYYEVRSHEAQHGSNDSTYWLIFELLWRDFFRLTAAKAGRRLFHRWSLQGAGPEWTHDREQFERWRTGRTGDAFVDANMRELLLTGWMSNRGRQNVASFLTKTWGVDWRWGAAWFESRLLDFDPASNYGNWAYVAGVGNDPRGSYRTFNTVKQADTYDASGAFRRLWLEESKSADET